MDNHYTNISSSIEHINEISAWVSSVQDLDQLLELIIETATRIMDAKASSLLLLDRKTQKLYFKVATGSKGTDIKQFEIDLGQGIAGHVAQTGEPLLIPDVAKDPRWYKEISESIGFRTAPEMGPQPAHDGDPDAERGSKGDQETLEQGYAPVQKASAKHR